jgi:hypothetical protein
MSVRATKRKTEVTFVWEYKRCTVTVNLAHEYHGGLGCLVPVLPFECTIDYERVADLMIETYGSRVKQADREQLVRELKAAGPYSLTIE